MWLLSPIMVAASMQSRSYLEGTLHTVSLHGPSLVEPVTKRTARSVERSQRPQLLKLCLPRFISNGPSFQILPLLGIDSSITINLSHTSKRGINHHPSYCLRCVVQVLTLIARHLARKWAFFRTSHKFLTDTSRPMFGIPLTMNDSTSVSGREVPCA